MTAAIHAHHLFSTGIAALALLLSGCSESTEKQPGNSRFPVRVIKLEKGTYTPEIELIAQMKPFRSVQLVPRVNGTLIKRNFTEGQFVRKGTLLYRIEPYQYQIRAAEAEAALAAARTRATRAGLDFIRINRLFQEKVASPQSYDSALAEKLESAAAVIAQESALSQAKLNLSYTEITAPFDGWIGLTRYDTGNYLPAAGEVLTTLSAIDPVRVEFHLSEAYLTPEMRGAMQQGITPGFEVRLLLPENSGTDGSGVIAYWENRIDPQSGTIRIQALFPNSKRTLMPGQFTRIKLIDPRQESVYFLKKEALRQEQNVNFVYTLNPEDRIVMKVVRLGEELADSFILRDGVSPEDRIVPRGNPYLRPGMAVEVLP